MEILYTNNAGHNIGEPKHLSDCHNGRSNRSWRSRKTPVRSLRATINQIITHILSLDRSYLNKCEAEMRGNVDVKRCGERILSGAWPAWYNMVYAEGASAVTLLRKRQNA